MFADIAVQHWAFAAYVIGAICICFLTMIGLAALLGTRLWPCQEQTLRIRVDSVGNARLRFSAKFYLVAMFFVIFDVEALYLFAWSVSVRESGWVGFIEATIFITLLLVGLLYLWRIGALDWAPKKRVLTDKKPD